MAYSSLTPAQIAASIKRAIQPTIDQQLQSAKSILSAADTRALNAEGSAKALAAMRQQAVGDTQKAYQTAAGTTAAFSKGYSDAMQAKVNGNAESLNEFLRLMGAPSGQMVQPSQIGDVSYGLTGALPASGLAAQGAAAGAYAAQQPGNALAAGSALAGSIRSAAQGDYENAVGKINAAVPGLVSRQMAVLVDAEAKASKAQADLAFKEEQEKNRHQVALANVKNAGQRVAETRRHNREMEAISRQRASEARRHNAVSESRDSGAVASNGPAGSDGYVFSKTAIANKSLTLSQNASLGTNYQWGYVGSGKNKRAVVVADSNNVPRKVPSQWQPSAPKNKLAAVNKAAFGAAKDLRGDSAAPPFGISRDQAIFEVSKRLMFEHPDWNSQQVHAAAVSAVSMQGGWEAPKPTTALTVAPSVLTDSNGFVVSPASSVYVEKVAR